MYFRKIKKSNQNATSNSVKQKLSKEREPAKDNFDKNQKLVTKINKEILNFHKNNYKSII